MATRKGPIRVLHFGLGPIGAAVVRQFAGRRGFKIVGAVDIDPAKVGRDLGEVAGVGRALRVKVSDDAKKTIKATKPDVAVLCTQLVAEEGAAADRGVLKLKVPIVSTTEELAYPTGAQHAATRARSTRWRRRRKVAVLGTGVNPGFTMDALPITLTGVCERVDSIRVDRIQDARVRRLPFQQKIGAGLTPRAVPEESGRRQRAPRRAGRIDLDDRRRDGLEARQDHRRDPAEDRDRDGGERVPRRRCRATSAASCRTASATATAQPVITLHMEAYLGAPESFDAVEIAGSPALKMKIAGGVHGDIATASITVNSIPKILEVRARPAHHARHADSLVLRRSAASRRRQSPAAVEAGSWHLAAAIWQLGAQHGQRVDPRRAPRGEQAREQRHQRQRYRDDRAASTDPTR